MWFSVIPLGLQKAHESVVFLFKLPSTEPTLHFPGQKDPSRLLGQRCQAGGVLLSRNLFQATKPAKQACSEVFIENQCLDFRGWHKGAMAASPFTFLIRVL